MRDADARRAFDFLDRISGMRQPEQIFDAFYSTIQGLGFVTYVVTGPPDPSRSFKQMCT